MLLGEPFIVSGLGQKTKGEVAESRSERRVLGDRRNVVQPIGHRRTTPLRSSLLCCEKPSADSLSSEVP
jgi:hypothetical protein